MSTTIVEDMDHPVNLLAPKNRVADAGIQPSTSIFTVDQDRKSDHEDARSWHSDDSKAERRLYHESRTGKFYSPRESPDTSQQLRCFTVAKQLQLYFDWERHQRSSLFRYIFSIITRESRPPLPAPSALQELALSNFGPIEKLQASICDFRDDIVEVRRVSLVDIENYFGKTPDGVSLRWINVPQELGPLSTSLCRLFKKCIDLSSTSTYAQTVPTIEHLQEQAATKFWMKVLTLSSARHIPSLREIFESLLPKTEDCGWHDGYYRVLNRIPAARQDGKINDPAAACWTNIPFQVGHARYRTLAGGRARNMSVLPHLRTQSVPGILCEGAISFRPRNDGTLLSFCTHYIFSRLLHGEDEVTRGSYADMFCEIFYDDEFRRRSLGHPMTMDWFMIYLSTRLSTAFHAVCGTTLQARYVENVQRLNGQRASTFRGKRARNHVLGYVKCMDELSLVQNFYTEKGTQLARLANSLSRQREEAGADQVDMLSDMIQRCNGAVERIKGETAKFPQMIEDLKSSLGVIFQLRTIEQNDAALLAESNNRAILVFTLITTIFLPLSFFTSYFGMNLKGVSDTQRTESYFWAVCGTSTVVIIALTMVFGFRERLYAAIWTRRQWSHPLTDDDDSQDERWSPPTEFDLD